MRKNSYISYRISNLSKLMELRQLKYFVHVAKTLSFSAAADTLFITQGTLSQQIKQLEDELGAELFTRTSRSVILTEAGTELLPIASRALQASDDCKLAMTNLRKGLSGTLNIGLTFSFRELLNSTVKTFLKANPQIKLNIFYKTSKELGDMIDDHEVDFILAFKSSDPHEELISEPLFESELCAVMHKNHPLANRSSLSVAELSRQRLALPCHGLQSRKVIDRFMATGKFPLESSVEINEPNMLMELLHGTNYVSILSSIVAKYDPALVAIPIDEMRHKMIGCVHWLKGAYRKKAAEVFIETLRDSNAILQI